MWNRACPLCFAKVRRTTVMAAPQELECAACHARLELSRASRVFGAAAGLAGSAIGFHVLASARPDFGWVLGVTGAVLGFGVGAALLLFWIADLVVIPKVSSTPSPQTHK